MRTCPLPPFLITGVIILLGAAARPAPAPTWLTAAPAGSRSATASGASLHPVLSADGTTAVFVSQAPDLVAGDVNGLQLDVFARALGGGPIERLSSTPAGSSGNARSHSPSVSADGRWIAFVSEASDLVPGDTNGEPDVFVHDRTTGRTRLVSVSAEGNAPARGGSHSPQITPDGRFVLFESSARDLVPGQASIFPGVFLRDLGAGVTHWINAPSDDPALATNSASLARSPVVSADGTRVVFHSTARNLAAAPRGNFSGLFVRDVAAGRTRMLDVLPASVTGQTVSIIGNLALQPEGRWLLAALVGPRELPDLGLQWIDLDGDRLIRASPTNLPASNATTEGPFLSRDGRTAVFEVRRTPLTTSGHPLVYAATQDGDPALVATNLVALDAGFTRLVPMAELLAADAECDHVAYLAPSPDRIGPTLASPRQLWVTKRSTGEARRMGRAASNAQAPSPSFSADGRLLLFASEDPELVPDDRNGAYDVFLYDWDTGNLTLVSTALDPAARRSLPASRIQGTPVVSAQGSHLVFIDPTAGSAPSLVVVDRLTGEESRRGAPGSFAPRLSADGRALAFLHASNGPAQAWLQPRADAPIVRASRTAHGAPAVQAVTDLDLAPDGLALAFVTSAALAASDSNGQPDVYLFEADTGALTWISPTSVSPLGSSRIGSLTWSPDGRTLLVAGEPFLAGPLPGTVNPRNPLWYAWDRETRRMRLLHGLPTGFGTGNTPDSALPVGTERPSFNREGTLAALTLVRQSQYTNMVVQSLTDPAVQSRIQHAELGSLDASGSRAVVRRTAPAEAAGRLQWIGTLGDGPAWVDAAPDGSRASTRARWWSLSADGEAAFFTSPAPHLVTTDTHGFTQLYVRDLRRGVTLLLSVGPDGQAARGPVSRPVHHAASDTVYFTTTADTLDPADVNELPDLYAVSLGESPVGLVATLSRVATGEISLVAPALPGHRYRAEVTDRIAAHAWQAVGAPQVATGTQVQFRDLPNLDQASRFYRVVRED